MRPRTYLTTSEPLAIVTRGRRDEGTDRARVPPHGMSARARRAHERAPVRRQMSAFPEDCQDYEGPTAESGIGSAWRCTRVSEGLGWPP